jgi:hypothetical protein
MFERAQSIQVASSFHYCRASQDSSQLIRALTFIIQQESNAELTGRAYNADKCAFSIKAMLTRAPVE